VRQAELSMRPACSERPVLPQRGALPAAARSQGLGPVRGTRLRPFVTCGSELWRAADACSLAMVPSPRLLPASGFLTLTAECLTEVLSGSALLELEEA
jgi:hypothetical protein